MCNLNCVFSVVSVFSDKMDSIGNRLWDTLQGQPAIYGSHSPNNSKKTTSSMFNDFFSDGGEKRSDETSVDTLGSFFTKAVGGVDPIAHNNFKVGSKSQFTKMNSSKSESTKNKNNTKANESNDNDTTSNNLGSSYADKFMERIISMAIPTTTTSSKSELDRILGRIEMQKTRPQLSMQTMSKNSILLLQRLSIPFETIDIMINFLNWKDPIITVIGMMFVTLTILKPINLLTLPLFYICFEIIVPAYMIQNPTIDESIQSWENELPKPVNEFSREFLLNVLDLQNHMLLYVNTWNFVNTWCWKLFYFRDEMLTWFIFVMLLLMGLTFEIFGSTFISLFFPYIKLLMVVLVWGIIISLHPNYRNKILETFYSEELRLKTMSTINHYEFKLIKDLDLTTVNMEIRQIEIFELQYYNDELKSWQFVCFSKDIYPRNSHIRLNDLPIEGVVSLDSIVPPDGWKFVNASDLLNNGVNNGNSNNNNNSVHSSNTENNPLLLFDYEKRKLLKDKKKYQKLLRKQNKAKKIPKGKRSHSQDFIINKIPASTQSNLQRRRVSNDFNNVLLDPLIINKKIIEQLETGVKLDGWYLDLCPSSWVANNYLEGVLNVDENSKWVYDLVVMGNGVNAYSAGLGVTSGKLKRSRGDVRRRRWIRYAVREIVQDVDSDILHTENGSDTDAIEDTSEEEIVDVDEEGDTDTDEENPNEGGKGESNANEIVTQESDNPHIYE